MAEAELNIVGSSKFGRYPKISLEKTFNMYISQNWLVNYPGFKARRDLGGGEGRGLYHSVRGNLLVAVVDSRVIVIGPTLTFTVVGTIDSFSGEVSIAENLNGQICIVDGAAAYIYNWSVSSGVVKQTLAADLLPNYVSYHNTFFLIGNNDRTANGAAWYVYQADGVDPTLIVLAQGGTQALQNKPDTAQAVIPIPGGGNHVMVLGQTVGVMFNQVGGLQNYQRVSSSNLNYGVVSVNTIAASDEMICWLSQNENNAPTIMFTTGGEPNRISTDGIDHLLDSLQYPAQSTAFFYRTDGHLFYQITFYNPLDNLSLVYDFTERKFYNLCDQEQNFHPMRQIVYFNNKTYGVSIRDAKLYEIGTMLTEYDYSINDNEDVYTIPRIRICKSIRKVNSDRFFIRGLNIWIEQGHDGGWVGINEEYPCDGYYVTEDGNDLYVTEDESAYYIWDQGSCLPYRPRVDIAMSKNGGQSFTNFVPKYLNVQGQHRNKFTLHQMGLANEVIFQFQFWMRSRTVVANGVVELE